MNEIDEAIDWQGAAISCDSRAHVAMRTNDRRRLEPACVHDRYARRIDRVSDWNRHIADAYVGHPHFEVRAIAAMHASLPLLTALFDDPEETVRWNAARRAAKRLRLGLRNDLSPSLLIRLIDDPEPEARRVVARRMPREWLPRMAVGPYPVVRMEGAQRLPRRLLIRLREDADWRVRSEVASRFAIDDIGALASDDDSFVRDVARSRLTVGSISGEEESR